MTYPNFLSEPPDLGFSTAFRLLSSNENPQHMRVSQIWRRVRDSFAPSMALTLYKLRAAWRLCKSAILSICHTPAGGSHPHNKGYHFSTGNKKPATCAGFSNMAESEGFEPPEGLTLRLISSQVHSTGLCQLSWSDANLNEIFMTVKG